MLKRVILLVGFLSTFSLSPAQHDAVATEAHSTTEVVSEVSAAEQEKAGL